MAKPKFTLTADLVNVEPEAIVASQSSTVSNVEIEQPQKKSHKIWKAEFEYSKRFKKKLSAMVYTKGF